MALISSIDGPTRRIYLSVGTITLDNLLAFYREYRSLRRTNEELRKYDSFMSVIGGQAKGGGKFIGRTVDLINTKIIPQDVDHDLLLTFEIIDSGNELSGRDVFDRTGLTSDVNVNIDIDIAPVEVITVNTGGSGLTTEEHNALLSIDAKTLYQNKIINNKKELKKNGSVWELIIYDDNGTTSILNKALKDKDGNNITDLTAGILSQELASTV